MDTAQWAIICDLFDRVVEQPPADRAASLAACPPEVRREVESLLAAHENAGGFIEERDPSPAPQTHLGDFVLLERVGRGGMGEVWRARRNTPEFTQDVAVKMLTGSVVSGDAERMFQRERQILAQLSHPHIVKLIDGGISGGRRYYAMEWVDGVPITDYCRNRPLAEKLDLFQQVCGAIHHAHQGLIVHRDLKPGNILVTASGEAKVLDFGIAKLLDAAAADVTKTVLRAMTLGYASPEQARGLASGIPTDIYALGLLLHELLSGSPAQPVAGKPLDEALRIICEQDPPQVAGVDRDLAAVVRKAVEKDPARRYASAQEFSDDLSRYRSGFPVQAENPTLRYVARKFVARNRATVAVGAAGLLVALVAIAGLVGQFQVARRERARAEQRFEAARKMARALIFEVPKSLANVPGTLEARKLMAEKASAYLEELARDSGGDPGLQRDIAVAYGRVGHSHWSNNEPHLGNREAAEKAQRRRVAILERLIATQSGDSALAIEFISALTDLSFVIAGNRTQEAIDLHNRTESIARKLAASHPKDLNVRRTLGRVLFSRAAQMRGREGLIRWDELEVHYSRLLAERPDSQEEQRNLALVYKYRSGVRESTQDLPGALQDCERARELDEARLAKAPQSRNVQLDLSFDYSNLGGMYFGAGQQSLGLGYFAKAIALREQLATSDPQDMRVRERLSWLLAQTASRLFQAGRYAEAAAHHRRSLEWGKGIAPRSWANWSPGDTYVSLAEALVKLGRNDEACRAARQSQDWKDRTPAAATPKQIMARDYALQATSWACKVKPGT